MMRGIRMAAVVAAATVVMVAATTAMASAAPRVTVSGPANVALKGSYTVGVAASEATGVVSLYHDGAVVGTATIAPGATRAFNVSFSKRGRHYLQASLETSTVPALSSTIQITAWGVPGAASFVTPAAGVPTARRTRFVVKTRGDTDSVTLYINGKAVRTVAVRPWSTVDVGTFWTGDLRTNVFSIYANNPVARTGAWTKRGLFTYPRNWHTCIVVDKSELKLYWVKNDVLVKRYMCAVGKPSTPTPVGTWRIGAKYYTAPTSVYGPRKMRMFRYSGGVYRYTAYNIHGTNNPPSIGTMASHGCIRMYPRDVLELFPQVSLYTLVQTRQ